MMLSAFLLASCGNKADTLESVAKSLSVDLSDNAILSSTDTHGGFHGDGSTYVEIDCAAAPIEDRILQNTGWHALPLSDTVTALVYGLDDGHTAAGPYLTDEDGNSLFPPIENGYYFFEDRHPERQNAADDAAVLSRASLNFTVALYDTDTNMLYYGELDT